MPGEKNEENVNPLHATITTNKISMTRPARTALQVLLHADGDQLYGEQIARVSRLGLGTIYLFPAGPAGRRWMDHQPQRRPACLRQPQPPQTPLQAADTPHLPHPDTRWPQGRPSMNRPSAGDRLQGVREPIEARVVE